MSHHRKPVKATIPTNRFITSRFSEISASADPKLCAKREGPKSDVEDRLHRFPFIHQADLILPSTALPLARKVKELVDDQCFTSVPNCHLGDLLTRGFLQSTGCRSSDSALLALSLARSDGDVVAIAAGRLVIHCSPERYAQLGLPGRASRFGPKKERYVIEVNLGQLAGAGKDASMKKFRTSLNRLGPFNMLFCSASIQEGYWSALTSVSVTPPIDETQPFTELRCNSELLYTSSGSKEDPLSHLGSLFDLESTTTTASRKRKRDTEAREVEKEELVNHLLDIAEDALDRKPMPSNSVPVKGSSLVVRMKGFLHPLFWPTIVRMIEAEHISQFCLSAHHFAHSPIGLRASTVLLPVSTRTKGKSRHKRTTGKAFGSDDERCSISQAQSGGFRLLALYQANKVDALLVQIE